MRRLDLPLAAIERTFDPGAMKRGRAYDAGRAVRTFTVRPTANGIRVTGAVQGTERYNVVVDLSHGAAERWLIDSRCSCPVGYGCKHAVALLLTARTDEPDPRAAWESDLDSALEGLEALHTPIASGRIPLGLMIEHSLRTPAWREEAARTLAIRPVRRGAKEAWVKTGTSWHDVQYTLPYRSEYAPSQVAVLRQMATAFQDLSSSQNPNLVTLGPVLWPLLDQARSAGIVLVPGSGVTDVEVTTPLDVEADLHGDAESFRLRVGLQVGETWWPAPGHEVQFLGRPAHGVALLRSVPAPGKRGVPHVELTLAPLTRTTATTVQRLLSTPLEITPDQRERFETTYLPRLRRQLPVGSRDRSVTLPEPARPRVQLAIAWGGQNRAVTSWGWRYGEETFALDSAEGFDRTRDERVERVVWDELTTRLPEEFLSAGQPPARLTWSGQGIVDLAEHLRPILVDLAAEGLFDLHEDGERKDYRAAEGAPEIGFGLTSEGEQAGADWLDLAISISVDGESVDLASVLTALTLGEELVFTASGRHVRSDHPAFGRLSELIAEAAQLADQPPGGLRVGRTDLSLWADLEDLGLVDAQAEEWLRAARALRDFDGLPTLRPVGLQTALRPYQQVGVNWMGFLQQNGLGGILADDMGLGKTLQTLALIAHARSRGAAPFLVVAPTSVVHAWVQQAAVHAPGLTVRPIHSSGARREAALTDVYDGADIIVTTYTLLRLDAEEYRELAWGGLILDEAQHVKNHQGKTYQAIRQVPAPFRLAVTGTPFENRLMELWSLLSIVAPGLYTSPKRFQESVARPVERSGDSEALARFRRRIRPFLLRRTKELVATDLPAKQEQVLEVDLSPRHRKIYDTHLARERLQVLRLVDDFQHNRIAIFRALTALRQLALDPALVDPKHERVGSAKLDVLVDQLTEVVGEGHQVLVFSQFTSYLTRVRARLESTGLSVSYLDGRTRKRAEAIERFTSGEAQVFLISLKAGGVGLTLTEADYVYVLDPWWNPATESQAVDRAHRIGQTKHVMVYRLVATDTIEEKVMALKERKAELFAQVLDGDGALSTELTAEDVRALLE